MLLNIANPSKDMSYFRSVPVPQWIVRLYRNGNPSERGLFHCEIPNASSNTEIRYVNIGECFHINPHGLWYRNLLLFS